MDQSPKRLRLYLIRHGRAVGSEQGRLFGRTDAALSETGRAQAQTLSERLASVDFQKIYSSDLVRASATAEIIAGARGIQVEQDVAWREIDMGNWEGCSLSDLYQTDPEMVSELFEDPGSFQYPNGESFRVFTSRIQESLKSLVATYTDGDIALVTHAGVIRTIVGTVLEMPMSLWLRVAQDYGCLNILEWHDGVPSVQLLNG